MASKTKDGLYCVKMYLTEAEYKKWDANRRSAELNESSYCRLMNLLEVRSCGAPVGNQNRKKGAARLRKEQRELRRKKQLAED